KRVDGASHNDVGGRAAVAVGVRECHHRAACFRQLIMAEREQGSGPAAVLVDCHGAVVRADAEGHKIGRVFDVGGSGRREHGRLVDGYSVGGACQEGRRGTAEVLRARQGNDLGGNRAGASVLKQCPSARVHENGAAHQRGAATRYWYVFAVRRDVFN